MQNDSSRSIAISELCYRGSVNLPSDASPTYTWELALVVYRVGRQIGLAILRFIKRSSRVTEGVQEDGQRVTTDRHGERRVLTEKALTSLLQPARPVQFSQLLQALRHKQSSRNSSG